MADINIELRTKIEWWVLPFVWIAGFMARFMDISEDKVIAIAKRGVKVEVVK